MHELKCSELKFCYRCLHKSGGTLQLEPGTCCSVFMACAVLHNRAIRAGLPEPEPLENEDQNEEDEEGDEHDNYNDVHSGIELRNQIANTLARF